MSSGDSVDRAFALILSDDRRKLPEQEEASAKALWRRVFRTTSDDDLYQATLTWLTENKVGRPNVGKIQEILKRAEKKLPTTTASPQRFAYDDRELRWAVSIMQDPFRFSGPYKHTLEMAEHVLRSRGYSDWRDAKAYLEPGWSPATVSEVYL